MDSSKPPPQGFGRGGRGAALLAALQSQQRRPGQDSTESSSVSPDSVSSGIAEFERAGGRGLVFQSMLQQNVRKPQIPGRGTLVSSLARVEPNDDVVGNGHRTVSSTSSSSESRETPFGRGRAASSSVLYIGRGRTPIQSSTPRSSVPSSISPPIASPVALSRELPVAELEGLNLKQYSGTAHTPISLEVNYVRLKTSPGKGIHEYHVSFNPVVDSRSMRFKLMNEQCVKEVTGSVKTFDGSKLYLPLKLSGQVTTLIAVMPTDGSPIVISIKYVSPCRQSDLLHLYNVLFRKIMHLLKMTQVGRNFFDPHNGIPVPQHKLEIWPGYITAIQEYEGGIMLNCDASFRVLRTITAREVIAEMSATSRGDFKDAVIKQLVGAIVLTRYNNKTYRIDDIDWNLTPRSTFTTHNGQEISFKDYYKNSYDITIKDENQPMLINMPSRKIGEESPRLICLVPELSYLTGLTDAMRSDFKVMKDIAIHTRITPNRRQMALQTFINNVRSFPETKKALADWNLELEDAVVSLDGRTLPMEDIYMRNKNFPAGPEADWGRNLAQDRLICSVNLDSWVVVFTRRDAPKANDFILMMKKVCPSMGIMVRDPVLCQIHNDRTESYRDAIKETVNPTVRIVVVIFPTARDDRYSAIKKLCCVEMPVPSQVINVRTISQYQKLRSVVQKIALQINCKLGGELWSIKIPLSNVMICGLDTYHDSSNRKQSVLAFISSLNPTMTRWFSMTAFQMPSQELGDALKILMIGALRKYYDINHKLPEKIIIYRDGVGDGLLEFVSKHEVEQYLSCFKHFDAHYSPSLSVVVVQKRINTRLFQLTGKNRDSVLENPKPGAVLDHTVTRKKWYDFFLISQHVRQGTVTPTHYVVVYDNSLLKPDHMQRLAYKMTHLYYNWPGTVRVPAPCQYAHKLAYLVGQNIHKEPHVSLCDKLFYL